MEGKKGGAPEESGSTDYRMDTVGCRLFHTIPHEICQRSSPQAPRRRRDHRGYQVGKCAFATLAVRMAAWSSWRTALAPFPLRG